METYLVQVIFGNGSFTDVYVSARTPEAAVAEVKKQFKGRDRWARYVI